MTTDFSPLKARLVEEKAKLEAELSGHGRNVHGDWQGTPNLPVDSADENEVADNIEELATNVAVVEELEARYKDVVHALSKFETGAYGTCEETGEPIPKERLEADPAARTKML